MVGRTSPTLIRELALADAYPTCSMDQPVPELRTDSLIGRSVFVAENRALRPNDFVGQPASTGGPEVVARSPSPCLFCAGNESRTPPAVYEKLDRHGRWQIRIVPNMYPAVVADLPSAVAQIGTPLSDSQQALSAFGAHEVIIESAKHIDRMSALSVEELRNVLEAYSARLRYWRETARFRYCLLFKNQGPRAGASIAHLHSQIIALPFVPAAVEAESARASAAYSQPRLCPYCCLLADEQAAANRVVFARDGFIAFCPFASWQQHEVWLMPTDHEPSFELAASGELNRLASVLHSLIERLESVVPAAAYNLMLRTAPWLDGCDDWSHWRMELLPRTNAFAGLELATGIHINPLAPERAAAQLRAE